MEQQVVIYEMFSVQRGQGQPVKRWWKYSLAQRVPKYVAPLDVIITIKVAATNGVGGKLKSQEYDSNDDRRSSQN
jgi:hypothetical protein